MLTNEIIKSKKCHLTLSIPGTAFMISDQVDQLFLYNLHILAWSHLPGKYANLMHTQEMMLAGCERREKH